MLKNSFPEESGRTNPLTFILSQIVQPYFGGFLFHFMLLELLMLLDSNAPYSFLMRRERSSLLNVRMMFAFSLLFCDAYLSLCVELLHISSLISDT